MEQEKMNKVRFLVEEFEESMEGLPWIDIKQYQEEFKDYIWKEFEVELEFIDGRIEF